MYRELFLVKLQAHIETSPPISYANQLNGFYMSLKLYLKRLREHCSSIFIATLNRWSLTY